MALFRHPEHFSIDYMNSLMVKKTPTELCIITQNKL